MSGKVATFWTTLPDGIVNGRVRVSVFVTPKLIGQAGQSLKLSDYPVFSDWINKASGIKFKLFARNGDELTQIGVYQPANSGELGLDKSVWNHIFQTRTIPVEPEQVEQSNMEITTKRRVNEEVVDVHYRNFVIDSLVSETQLLHTRSSFLNPGSSPKPIYMREQNEESYSFESIDRLVQLAASPDRGLVSKAFPTKNEDTGDYSYRDATSVSEIFKHDDEISLLNKNIDFSVLSDIEVRKHYESFANYHRHGVTNKNYQIRSGSTERSSSPEFNFYGQDSYSVELLDDGKLLEFAEPMEVYLPPVSSVPPGFKISIFYNPNEPSPDEEDKVAAVLAHSGEEFSGGGIKVVLPAFRGKVITRSDIGNWTERPIEQQDFHSIISGLGSYPILLRKLGIVFDLEFNEADIPFSEHDLSLLAEPIFEANHVLDDLSVYPLWSRATRSELEAELGGGIKIKTFSMTPMSNHNVGGLKVLNSNNVNRYPYIGHNFYDLDVVAAKIFHKAIVDGAPVEAGDPYHDSNPYSIDDRILIPGSPYAAAKEIGIEKRAFYLEDTYQLPPARSTGISIYLDREGRIAADVYKNEDKNIKTIKRSSKPDVFWPDQKVGVPDLYLEDVSVGCKVDVFVGDSNGALPSSSYSHWYPLCNRQLTFNYGESTTLSQYLAPSDEFWVETVASSEVDENGVIQLRANDYLFRWDGWSLVAPHPSRPAAETGSDTSNDWTRSVDVVINSETEAITNAKLRYGRDYWFRARSTDLAGNAVDFDFANVLMGNPGDSLSNKLSSEKITYRRYDPISPPTLYPLQPPGPGSKAKKSENDKDNRSEMAGPDKSDILVIRSGENVSQKLQSAEWLVMAPETDLQEAEWAGMLDGFSDPDTAYSTLVKYSKQLPKSYDPDFIKSIKWESGEIGTPYLPDGYAAGATFCYLPGGNERVLSEKSLSFKEKISASLATHYPVSFKLNAQISNNNSPYSKSFKLRLIAGKRGTTFTNDSLNIHLPPGEQQLVMLSSYPDEKRLDHFQLIHAAFHDDRNALVQTNLNVAPILNVSNFVSEKSHIMQSIKMGLNWPISPAKPIRLIHAVPKPVQPPEFSDDLQLTNRVTGGNAIVMEDRNFKLHRVSTGKVDIFAEWDEFIDAPGASEFPIIRRERRHCFKCDIPLPDTTIDPDITHFTFDIGSRHNLPSNKHLAISYVAVATTRYREYFGDDVTSEPANLSVESEPSCELHVYNTAPPPPPEIVYILPLFIWEDEITEDGGETKQTVEIVTRKSGFRIYLKRNWFKSGADERLAVVLQSEHERETNKSDLETSSRPLTHWASDPILYDRSPITRQPTLKDFRATVHKIKACKPVSNVDFDKSLDNEPIVSGCNSVPEQCIVSGIEGIPLPPPTIPSIQSVKLSKSEGKKKSREADIQGADLDSSHEVSVDIAAYEVKYDPNKDLLYVDIEIESPGSYMPFVKFSLSRYQHYSAKYCHLSSVVDVDFVQLSPERSMHIRRNMDQSNTISIKVYGSSKGNEKRGFNENHLSVSKKVDGQYQEQYPFVTNAIFDESKGIMVWSIDTTIEKETSLIVTEIERIDNVERIVFSHEIHYRDVFYA